MSGLINWLQTLVVFILLAVIIEMLLPNSAMQRYVKIVVSLLMLTIILQPLFSIFSDRAVEFISDFQEANVVSESQLKSSLEMQKVDIQSAQHAYISEQVAVQLKRQVEEELQTEFQVGIDRLHFIFADEKIETFAPESLEKVLVYVRSSEEALPTRPIQRVELITIRSGERLREEKNDNISKQFATIERFLAKEWNIDRHMIELIWEGGERTDG